MFLIISETSTNKNGQSINGTRCMNVKFYITKNAWADVPNVQNRRIQTKPFKSNGLQCIKANSISQVRDEDVAPILYIERHMNNVPTVDKCIVALFEQHTDSFCRKCSAKY